RRTEHADHPGPYAERAKARGVNSDDGLETVGAHRFRFICQWQRGSHLPVTDRRAVMISAGVGGQPGISRSTATTSPTAPTTPYASLNSPRFSAQSPQAITTRGWGVAATVLRNGSTMLRVTTPVTSSASAWRGEATSRAPYCSASYTGPNAPPISTSHPLQDPAS